MTVAGTAAVIDHLPTNLKDEVLKTLAAELGFILHSASRTFSLFQRE